jgi:hypothetical protein
VRYHRRRDQALATDLGEVLGCRDLHQGALRLYFRWLAGRSLSNFDHVTRNCCRDFSNGQDHEVWHGFSEKILKQRRSLQFWNETRTSVLAQFTQRLDNVMTSKFIAIALLSTALMTGIASAQTSTMTPADRTNTRAVDHKDGPWRSSKLVGVDVYNGANEKIGSIQELIVDKSGKVENAILGVGGFLGMDEHYVAVGFDKLKWFNEPLRTATTSPAASSATNGRHER